MDAAGHEVIARAFRRALGQDRRLDLREALGIEIAADGHHHAVAQQQVLLHAGPAQIEVAIPQPHLLRDRPVVGNRERRPPGFIEDPELANEHLDFAGLQLRIDRLRRSALDRPDHRHHELGLQLLGPFDDPLVIASDGLCQPVAIADVEEQQRAEVADAVHPAEQHDLPADVLRPEGAAGVGATKIAEHVRHEGSPKNKAKR